MQLYPTTVPTAVSSAIADAGGFLDGIWRLHQNAGHTQFNWSTDVTTWLGVRKSPMEIPLENFYKTERAVSQWLKKMDTVVEVNKIAEILCKDEIMDRKSSLGLDVSGFPTLLLPERLVPDL